MNALRTAALAAALAVATIVAMAGALEFTVQQRAGTAVTQIVNQAFDAALHVSAPSAQLVASLSPNKADREIVAVRSSAPSLTVEQRVEAATSVLVRMHEKTLAQR